MDNTPRSRTSRLLKASTENEFTRLHRDAEMFTQKLESERRTTLQLDELIRETSLLLEKKQSASKLANTRKIVNSHDSELINNLELQLNRARIDLGELQVSNRRLRIEIDVLRRGNLDFLNTSKRLDRELDTVHEETEQTKRRGCRSVASCKTVRHKMNVLQEAKQTIILNSSQRVTSLHHEILEDRQIKRDMLLSLLNAPIPTELSEAGHVVKHLTKKWHSLLREKRKEVDSYMNYIADLSSGFNEMMKSSCIDTLKSTVTSLLNSLERQREIHKHIVTLSEQTDEIQEDVVSARRCMEALTSSEKSQYATFRDIKTQLSVEIQAMKKQADSGNKMLDVVAQEIGLLRGPMEQLFLACGSLELRTELNKDDKMSDFSDFSLYTAPKYFSYLQELSDKLISVITSRRHPMAPQLSALTPKRFHKPRDVFPLIDPDSLQHDDDIYPLTTSQFRLRARKMMNK